MIEFEVNSLTMRRNFDGTYDITTTSKINESTANSLMDEFKSRKRVFLCQMFQKPKKRSLDANSYCFVLCTKLAEKLNSTKEEIYKNAIRDVGQYEIIPIRNDALENWIHSWESRGIGWQSITMEPAKFDGYTKTINYFGSSVYDSKAMSILIDNIVNDCKDQGIETATPQELERMKNEWINK